MCNVKHIYIYTRTIRQRRLEIVGESLNKRHFSLLSPSSSFLGSGEMTFLGKPRASGIRARNLILKARSAHEARSRARVEENGGYTGPGLLKFIFCYMYSLSFKFFRLQSAEALRSSFLRSVFPTLFFFFLSLGLCRFLLSLSSISVGLLHHLDRCICASLRRPPPSYLTGEIFEDAYLARLHQISHVAEHLLNLLTLWASRELHRKLGKISLLVPPAN